MMNYPVTHHLRLMFSRCSWLWKGKVLLISFNSIVQPGRSAPSSRVLEGDVTEEDEDDEDGIRISIRKQGNSVKLVNYKSVMLST